MRLLIRFAYTCTVVCIERTGNIGIIVTILSLLYINGFAQQRTTTDTAKAAALTEVVVTATRTERQLSSLPIPATLVSQQQIRSMGSMRLGDVLQEQTGLAIINDHGQGIQVQGFSPDYTLILIDGEPLIGRTAGTLELSRVAVGNIKQIEIVKGPSSSLYGSEALAGVINIITDKPAGLQGNIKARYGSNDNSAFTGNISVRQNKLGVYAFVDRYASNGYDLTPDVYGKTVDPFAAYTFTSKISYDLSPRTQLTLSGRYFTEKQQGNSAVDSDFIHTTGKQTDWNITPAMQHRFNDRLRLQAKWYSSRYKTNSTSLYQAKDSLFDASYFIQTFNRPEAVLEYAPNKKHAFTAGAGYIHETVEATRYTSSKQLNTLYALVNYEWNWNDKAGIVAGARFDKQSVYGSQLSPKFAAKYKITPWLMLRGSVGMGFKAPDFRQLYLNFTNATEGYSVFGTEEVIAGIARLQSQGQISEILISPGSVGEIKAESSVAYNAGGVFGFCNNAITGNINLFRNDITDMIETQGIARKTNGQLVYSYRNLSKVFTQGLETEWNYRPVKALSVAVGYQYLDAKDVAVWNSVKAGKVYRRDAATQVTTRVSREDYGGLFNRSKHSGNVKLLYDNDRYDFTISLRCIYRGRYGVADKNNNEILDADNEYVKGYTLWNTAVTKNIARCIALQAGVDNLFNFKNTGYMPGIAGRLWFASISYSFSKQQQHQ